MINKILNSQTKSVSKASLILFGSYFLSAILGLLRDRLLAGKFGAGDSLDSYYAAFVVPDFVALILIFGAISAAIIPIFSSYYVKSKEEAWEYTTDLINIFMVFLILVSVILIIFAPFVVSLIAPGFSEVKKVDTVILMRIMFLSPIILGLSNIISGILQVFKRFLVTALAPVMYNLGIILGIVFFVPTFGLIGLAFGVILGGLLHLLIQLPSFFNSGFKYKAVFSLRHAGVRKTLKLMVPRSIGLGAGQINTIFITSIASTLTTGSVAVFNLANNLSAMSVNAIAVSLSTAIFPAMSLAFSKDDSQDFEKKFSGALRHILFLIIPLSVLMFILRAQIVRVILGVGKFGWLDTRLTAACFGIFAIGLLAQALVLILSKTFYAGHNTRIPAIASIVTVVFNILLSFLLVWLLSLNGMLFNATQYLLRLQGIEDIRIIGLALALSITTILEAIVLLYMIFWKFKSLKSKNIASSFYKILLSTFLMGVATFLIRQGLIIFKIVQLQTFLGVFLQLAVSTFFGVAFYIITCHFLKSSELKDIKQFFSKN